MCTTKYNWWRVWCLNTCLTNLQIIGVVFNLLVCLPCENGGLFALFASRERRAHSVHHISERATWNIDKDMFLPVLTSLKVTALWFLSCSLIEGWDSSRKAPSPVPVAILEFLSSCSFLPPFFFFWFGSLSFLDFEVTLTEGGLLGEGGLAGVGQDGGSETK